jgi:glycosyltransferase involved in cell wall biosynthesis
LKYRFALSFKQFFMENAGILKLSGGIDQWNSPRLISSEYEMIVFCHLRWQFVYQRPQHIISRMSRKYKVLFVEEPISSTEGQEHTAELKKIHENLHVLQLRGQHMDDIIELLPNFIPDKHAQIAWFYSPAFCSILNHIRFETIVYDCMDELSLFKGAPESLISQEKILLSKSNVVFTGGKSLFNSKSKHHEKVYCFPSSVDEDHFARAKNGLALPPDISQIKKPIVGYFGVIDERIDLDLICESARRLPHVSFVMIGPLAKISESALPHSSNIHYLGMKAYQDLPAYLKAFDIAMMPFALNDATKFISPTKTLEYMAAGKPIISTRIKDVERDYSHCIHLVDNVQEFCAAVIELNRSRFPHSHCYKEILMQTSWDLTAQKMQFILNDIAQ